MSSESSIRYLIGDKMEPLCKLVGRRGDDILGNLIIENALFFLLEIVWSPLVSTIPHVSPCGAARTKELRVPLPELDHCPIVLLPGWFCLHRLVVPKQHVSFELKRKLTALFFF